MKIVHEASRNCLQVSEISEVHTRKGQIRKAIEVLDFLTQTFSAFMYLPMTLDRSINLFAIQKHFLRES